MKVVKANVHTAVCEERLVSPATAAHSNAWSMRVWRAERAKRDPCICAMRSGYIIDGTPYCLNHAGQRALKFLMENGNG